jgi:predicted metal-dependent enzyme (double-stranded beta helix superfamily)
MDERPTRDEPSAPGARAIVEQLRSVRDDPAAVAEVLGELVRDPRELELALGVEDRCGITVLEASPDLTVQRVVWPAGIRVPPHDHNMWAAVGVYRGREDNRLFRRADDRVAEAGGHRVEAGHVLTLDRDAIHAVANTAAAPCVALHVYGGDLDHTPRTTWVPDERPFDPDGMWRAIGAFRAREDDLGRPLTPDETSAMMARAR